MAKRKKRTTNTRNTGKRKTNKKQQNKSKLDIEVVALFVLSILLAVLIYAKSGIIGENLNIVLGGIMGWLKYILPIGTFIMAIYMVIDEEQKESFAGKIINYTVFLLCLMSLMTIYQISKGSLKISYEFQTLVSRAYELGSQNVGGGAIGAIIAIPASKLLGMWGAAILFIGIALINIVYMFKIKPAEMLGNYIKEKSEEKYANLYDEEDDDDTEEIILKRAKKKAKKIKQAQEDLPMEDQITINLNNQPKKLKKYKHEADELIPLTKESKQEKEQFSPNHIEENLFKQEEEKKEEKVKEVLTLEHAAMTVEDETYEFPPVELLSEGKGVVLKGGKKALADTATKLPKNTL